MSVRSDSTFSQDSILGYQCLNQMMTPLPPGFLHGSSADPHAAASGSATGAASIYCGASVLSGITDMTDFASVADRSLFHFNEVWEHKEKADFTPSRGLVPHGVMLEGPAPPLSAVPVGQAPPRARQFWYYHM